VLIIAQRAWQVQRMVVAPRCQGRGLGSACLSAALRRRVPTGGLVSLSTNEERNVTFYRRLGFALVLEQVAPPSFDSVRNWHLTWTAP
jgi:GNAT superfamily N-acetyltransferase